MIKDDTINHFSNFIIMYIGGFLPPKQIKFLTPPLPINGYIH